MNQLSDIKYNQFISVDLVIDHIDDGVFSVNQPSSYASEGDLNGRTANIQITERGKVGTISGLSINAVWTNFATGVTDITALELIDADTSVYRFTYPNHMMTAGRVEVKFQLIYNGKVSLTRPFIITVLPIKGNFTALIESQQFSALTQALNHVNQYDTEIAKKVDQTEYDIEIASKADKQDTNNSLASLQQSKADKSFVDSQFASIVSGAPKGTFATLSALQSSYPNGTEGVFLVLENGHWYYYASGWKDGGVYQATGIADNSITNEKYKDGSIPPSKTTFLKINPEKNQFNKDELIEGKYWDDRGVEGISSTVKSTNFISCHEKTKLFINIYSYITFWDENKNFISGTINANIYNSLAVLDIPPTAYYVKLSINSSINTDLSILYIILSNNYDATIANFENLKTLEYYEPDLVLYDNNIKNLGLMKKDEIVNLSPADYIVLPNKVFTTTKELLSWTNTIMLNKKNVEIKVSYSTGPTDWGKRVYNFDEFDWSKVPANTTVSVFFSSNNELKYKKDIIVRKKSTNPTTNTINLLCIGDSITNRGLANSVSNYLGTQYGLMVTSVGTMINNFSQKGEGREGWKFTNFTGKDWVSQVKTQIIPATGATNNELSVNPFVKIATSSDLANNPNYCYDLNGKSYSEVSTSGTYYIYDFANYLSVQSIATPDIITIALSTNDILSGSSTYNDDCKNALLFMIKKIREALPTVKIGVVPTFNFGMDKSGNESQLKALKWTKVCIEEIEALADENCDVIPTYMSVDRLSAYNTTTVASSENSNVQEATITDTVHTNSINVHANAIAQWVVNVLD